MSIERAARVEAIFLEAVALPADQRAAHLDRACAGDAALRGEVESLLTHHGSDDGLLESRDAPGLNLLSQFGAMALPTEEPTLPDDRRIGTYTVEGLLGSGGMGVVYLARQERPRRTVALKVLRAGAGSARLLRRFEYEAEVLGRLQHPGIAQVYEAGVYRGGGGVYPFIAMELVRGRTLTAYAQERSLDLRGRLDLFARVCDAVQHAHQHGVIHRDLKPANILVADPPAGHTGEHAQPKVLDFGVARAMDDGRNDTTAHTHVGQIIGTLPYMSPEQIGGAPDAVDTRSDVYALGVVLYEMLAGRLPYDVKSRSLPDAARVIRDEEPTRLSTIARVFRGDVETIVATALAKERHRRYQSAAELAADVRRFLAGEPLSARRDSAMYVLRKNLRRYRGIVAVCAVALTALVAFAVYAGVQARRQSLLADGERRASAVALAAQNEAVRASDELRRQLTYSTIERGRLLGLSGNLHAAESLLWPEHLRALDSHQTFYALWELYSNSRCAATLALGQPRAWRLRLSPDGRTLAATGTDPALLLYDTATLEQTAQIAGDGSPYLALAWSPKGSVVLGNERGRIALHDGHDGRELAVLRDGGPGVLDLVFSDGGTRLYASLDDGTLAEFDPDAPAPAPARSLRLATQGSREPRGSALALRPGGRVLAVGCSDATIRMVELADFTETRSIANPEESVPRLAFSPDGATLACNGSSRVTRLFDPDSGEVKATLTAPNGSMGGAAFTPDGRRLLTSGWWYLHVWNVAERRIEQTFSLEVAGIEPQVSPDGSTGWLNLSRTARAWDLNPNSGQHRLALSPTSRTLARFAGDGMLITGEGDGSVMLINDADGATVATLGKVNRRIRAIAVHPTEPLAASVSVDGVLCLFDLHRRQLIGQWAGFRMATNDGVRFDPSGTRLLLPAADSSFRVIEVPSGRVALTIPAGGPGEALGVAWSPDGGRIAVSTRQPAMRLYDARSGALIREFDAPPSAPWTVVFSPDGRHVFSGSWDRSIGVWNVETGKLERRLEGHRGLVTSLAFRPREPNILASAGADGRIMLWDVALPQDTPVLALDALDGWEIWALDFDRAGRHIVATNSPGQTVVWDLRHFNRHMGGNMLAQIRLHRESLGPAFDEAAALEQRRLLLNRGRPAPVADPKQSPATKTGAP